MSKTLRQLFGFALAGILGLLVDIAVLYAMLALGAGLYAGRIVSFLAAVAMTWVVNRHFTFAAPASPWRYLAAMSGGALVNLAAYSLSLQLLPQQPWLPGAAVALGSLAGLSVNFVSAKFFVFKS